MLQSAPMIPLFCSFMRRKDMDSVLSCLVTDSIGPGEFTEKFLKTAKEVFLFDAGVALRSPVNALGHAIDSVGLVSGNKVAISPLAPRFHKDILAQRGLIPAYYDHDFEMGAIDWDSLLQLSASAAILFHPFGLLPDPEACASATIPLIEDMTQALGAERKGVKAGNFGNLVLYGMEQGSIVTAGGGALLFSSRRRDASIIRSISEQLIEETRLTDYNAALGFAQLREFKRSFEKREELERNFDNALAGTRHRTLRQPDEGMTGRYAYPVILDGSVKDAIVHGKKNGVEVEAAFDRSIINEDGFPEGVCANARSLALRTIAMPLHERISSTDAKTIAKVIATLP